MDAMHSNTLEPNLGAWPIRVRWARGPWFPLRKLFNQVVFGDLDRHLAMAAAQGEIEAARRWVIRGADIRANDDLALRLADKHGHEAVVHWLVSRGADPAAIDDTPRTESAMRWISAFASARATGKLHLPSSP